jgi:Lipopolysaccharide kinase (Kdo/WaaP) family
VRVDHEVVAIQVAVEALGIVQLAHGQAWIVDFDKCGFRPGDSWKVDNLERLRRSLRKELRLDPDFRWDETQWADFLTGYLDVGATGAVA